MPIPFSNSAEGSAADDALAKSGGEDGKALLYSAHNARSRVSLDASDINRLRSKSESAIASVDSPISGQGQQPPSPSMAPVQSLPVIAADPAARDGGDPSGGDALLGPDAQLGSDPAGDLDAMPLASGAAPAVAGSPAAGPADAPKSVAENGTMKLIWSAVSKKLAVPNLDGARSPRADELKHDLDKYHGELEELKKGMSAIDPDAKPAKNKKADSQEGQKELLELRARLHELKQLNEKLASLEKKDFPGGDDDFAAWQTDLQSHAAAFDALMSILERIMKGESFAKPLPSDKKD